MILNIGGNGHAQLVEAGDLQRLRCEIAMPPADEGRWQTACQGIASIEADHAWIAIAWLKAAGTLSQDADWPHRFETMIDKARPHGWVSADGQSVRAHIVWNKPQKETP